MSSETSDEADRLLVSFDDLTELPVSAFIHALKLGAVFPLPGTVLSVEQARIFATALKADMPFLRDAAIYASFAAESDQDILWAHALACASLQSSDWEKKRDKELLYAFVRTESRFLTHCYSVYALNHPAYLGAQQRFALHLVNTFAVLHPSLVDAAFTPFTKTDVHFALSELRLAAYDFPQCKAVVEAVLDDLTAE